MGLCARSINHQNWGNKLRLNGDNMKEELETIKAKMEVIYKWILEKELGVTSITHSTDVILIRKRRVNDFNKNTIPAEKSWTD